MIESPTLHLIFGHLIPGSIFGAAAFFAVLAGRKGWLIYRLRRLRRRPAD